MRSRTILFLVVLVCAAARTAVKLSGGLININGLIGNATSKHVVSSTLIKSSYSSESTTTSACSCWNVQAPPNCCERTIFPGHKFGYVLIRSLFGEFRYKKIGVDLGKMDAYSTNETLPKNRDYRHVVVTRNFVDAIVSGYLYHKSGRECRFDMFGAPTRKRFNRTIYWDAELNYHWSQNVPYPPRSNRSLCSYLEEESEEDGMRVLMDVAFSTWYSGHLSYWNLVKQQNDSQERSLFMCYENLADPFQQERLFHSILDWAFPGQDMNNATLPREARTSLIRQQQNQQSAYKGPHSSSHDPQLRARLQALVERYDGELFNGAVAKSNAIFGCGMQHTHE